MVITLAVVAWLGLGLAVALLVGAGVHHPAPRSTRRYVPSTASGRRDPSPRRRDVLYVVERGHRARRARRLARAGHGLH